jgi:hypothetical protein
MIVVNEFERFAVTQGSRDKAYQENHCFCFHFYLRTVFIDYTVIPVLDKVSPAG